MEAEKIIKEKEIVHEDEHKDYASKGVGNAGLTLGIIGTALGAWAVSRNRGGLFGGGWGAGMPENVNINTTTGGGGGSGVNCWNHLYRLNFKNGRQSFTQKIIRNNGHYYHFPFGSLLAYHVEIFVLHTLYS